VKVQSIFNITARPTAQEDKGISSYTIVALSWKGGCSSKEMFGRICLFQFSVEMELIWLKPFTTEEPNKTASLLHQGLWV
jgi:hypothetical protein